MKYVDGFVLVVPKRNIEKYKGMAASASKYGKNMAPWSIINVLVTI